MLDLGSPLSTLSRVSRHDEIFHGRNHPNRQPSQGSRGRLICKVDSILFRPTQRVLDCEWSWTNPLGKASARGCRLERSSLQIGMAPREARSPYQPFASFFFRRDWKVRGRDRTEEKKDHGDRDRLKAVVIVVLGSTK